MPGGGGGESRRMVFQYFSCFSIFEFQLFIKNARTHSHTLFFREIRGIAHGERWTPLRKLSVTIALDITALVAIGDDDHRDSIGPRICDPQPLPVASNR